MLKKILPLLLILLLGCNSDDNTPDCEYPHYYSINKIDLRLIDRQTGVDLLKSGAIDFNELSATQLPDNQSADIYHGINMSDETHSVIISFLYQTAPVSLSYQFKKNGTDFFTISFDIVDKETNPCVRSQSIQNFTVDHYTFEKEKGVY
ncbi:MAG TPA: hypothetical protein VJL37_01865, partial [Flavobacterium sp.]|nr:hypothetical protein [Flavobacterium sp.]